MSDNTCAGLKVATQCSYTARAKKKKKKKERNEERKQLEIRRGSAD